MPGSVPPHTAARADAPGARPGRARPAAHAVRGRVAGRHAGAPLVIAVGCAALLGWGVLTHQWWTADEWAFLVRRGRSAGLTDALLRPHNEHWSTLPALAQRALFGVVGLRAYWPSLALSLACHGVVVWLVVRRAGAALTASGQAERHAAVTGRVAAGVAHAVAAPVDRRVRRCVVWGVGALMLACGAGAENVWWSFQLAWTASLALGLAFLEVSEHAPASRPHLVVGWLLGAGALMCSTVGVPMVVAVACTVALRVAGGPSGGGPVRTRLRTLIGAAAVVVGPCMALQLAYTVAWGRSARTPKPVDWSALAHQVLPYVWRSLAAPFEVSSGVPLLGGLAVLGLLWWAVSRGAALAQGAPEVLGLAAAAVLFLVTVAIGRAGIDNAGASRYSYVVLVLTLPLAAHLLGSLVPRLGGAGRAAAAVAGVLVIANSTGLLLDAATTEGTLEQGQRERIAAAFTLVRSGFAIGSAIPEPASPDLDAAAVRALIASGHDVRADVRPAVLTDVQRRLVADVAGAPRHVLDPASADLLSLRGGTAVAAESGCLRITPAGSAPTLLLRPRQPLSFKAVVYAPGALVVGYELDGRAASALPTDAVPDTPYFVNLADPRAVYSITLPATGPSNLCGLGGRLPVDR